jgi:hypothetical protein
MGNLTTKRISFELIKYYLKKGTFIVHLRYKNAHL